MNYIVIALIVLGLAACQKNESAANGDETGDPVVVSINIKKSAGVTSRADGNVIVGTNAENAITKIEFFVYEADGSKDNKYPYHSPTSVATGTHTFLVSEGAGKQFLVAINQYLGENAMEDTYDDMLKVLTTKALFTNAPANYSQTAIEENIGYAMSGSGQKDIIMGNTNHLDIDVSRVISRVRAPKVKGSGMVLTAADLFSSTPVDDLATYMTEIFGSDYTDLGEAPVENLKWEFTGYVLINGIDKSYAFTNKEDNWDTTGKTYFKTGYTTEDGLEISSVYGGASAGDKFLPANNTGEIFVYENIPGLIVGDGSSNSPVIFQQDQVTAFIVKGQFSATNINGGSPVTRYWRVNLIKDDHWKIYRNCVYEVTMNSINTPGFSSPKEAENDGPIIHPDESTISIDLNIMPWGFKTQGVDL